MTKQASFLWWAALFGALAILTRFYSLNWEIVAWDEETFMVLSQEVLHGNLPYIHEFDNKPPGLFLALAGMMKVFGASLVTVRFFGAICAFATTVATFLITARLTNQTVAGITACLVPLLNFGGVYTTAELPAAAFLMAGIWVCLRYGQSALGAALTGLCFSLATLFRTNLIVDVVCLGLIYGAAIWVSRLGLHRQGVLFYGLVGLVPPLLLTSVYAITGHLREFVEAAIVVPLSYSGGQHSPWDLAVMVLGKSVLLAADQGSRHGLVIVLLSCTAAVLGALAVSLGRYRAFSIMPGQVSAPSPHAPPSSLALGEGQIGDWRRRLFSIVQPLGPGVDPFRDQLILSVLFAASLLATVINGVFYAHYLDDLTPFLSIALALVIQAARRVEVRLWLLGLTTIGVLLGVGVYGAGAVDVAAHYRRVLRSYDARHAAALIAADLKPEDQVWAPEYHLVYFYLDRRPPTPLSTHPDNVLRTAILGPMARDGFAAPDEIDKIMRTKPKYIVTDYDEPVPTYMVKLDGYTSNGAGDRFRRLLVADYQQYGRAGHILIYRRKDAPSNPPDRANPQLR